MYLALWIDKTVDDPKDRIVICEPLMSRLGTANAVLNSQRREDAPSLIFSGDQDRLERFVQEIVGGENKLTELSIPQLLDGLVNLGDYCGISSVPFPHPVDAAIRRNPKPGYYPRFITPKAKPVWDTVLEEHKKTLDKYKSDKAKMWAAALVIFQRYCHDRGIQPFTKDPAHDQARKTAVNEINRRVNQGFAKALDRTDEIYKDLKIANLVTILTKPKFYEIATQRSLYYVSLYRWAKLARDVKPQAVIDFLLSRPGFIGKPGQYAHWNLGALTDILIEPKGKDVFFYIVTSLTRDNVILLFDLPETADWEMILKHLRPAGKQWLDTGLLVDIE